MKILVTGSSGFIGFHLSVLLLKKGNKVLGIDCMNNYYDVNLKKARLNILRKYKNFSFNKINLENEKKVKNIFTKFKPDIAIHLAAQAGVRYSIDKPRVYLKSNIDGTFNVIEASYKIGVKHLIMASSSSVYGANKRIPFKETDKTETQLSIYAATKKANESMAHSYSNIWKIPITMLRFFTVYGPWGRPDMALFKFTKGILKNNPIDVYNKGNMFRDFTYIDDIVNGIYLLLNKIPNKKQLGKFKNDSLSAVAPFRTLNIGNSKKILLLDFLKEIEFRLKKKSIINFMPLQRGDVKETLSDITLIKSLTNYNPKTDFRKGIDELIKWYKLYYRIK
jgi:UDP-glucuronate 4-epimerase